jgi:hypothetical protein
VQPGKGILFFEYLLIGCCKTWYTGSREAIAEESLALTQIYLVGGRVVRQGQETNSQEYEKELTAALLTKHTC